MFLKRETEYAALGLKILSESPEEFVDVSRLSRETQISAVLMAKTLQKLVKAGLVESKFGPTGGFRILRDPKDISFLEIATATQDLRVINCFEGAAPHCKREKACTMKQVVKGLQTTINGYLERVKLSEVN